MDNILEHICEPKVLGEYIESLIFYEIREASNFKLIPNGRLQLIFQHNCQIQHSTPFTKGWEKRPDNFIAGPFTEAYNIENSGQSFVLSVVFKPGKYRYFFPNPITEFTNNVISMDDIWGAKSNELIDSLYGTQSVSEKCNLLEKFLIPTFHEKDPSPLELVAHEIIRKKGLVSIHEISLLSNLSNSQFRKRFTKEIGLSPKTFQKIIRLNALEDYKNKKEELSLTALAAEFEYTDQSHFIKDFKSLVGCTPKEYFY